MESKLDIVIPIYNSKKFIDPLIERMIDFAFHTPISFQVCFVDDGGTDGSYDYIKNLKLPFNVTLIKLKKNYGQHTATAVGLSYCESEFCVTIDDDLQHDPFDIPTLLEEMHNSKADVVYGNYHEKRHNSVRNYGSWLLKKIVSNDNVNYDLVTSFRLMKCNIAKQVGFRRTRIGFLDQLILSSTNEISRVNVEHRASSAERSRYSWIKLIRMALSIIIFHSSLPIHFILRIGILASILFVLMGFYFFFGGLIDEIPLSFLFTPLTFFYASLALIVIVFAARYVHNSSNVKQEKNEVLIDEVCHR